LTHDKTTRLRLFDDGVCRSRRDLREADVPNPDPGGSKDLEVFTCGAT
jgi:hypothetical protein